LQEVEPNSESNSYFPNRIRTRHLLARRTARGGRRRLAAALCRIQGSLRRPSSAHQVVVQAGDSTVRIFRLMNASRSSASSISRPIHVIADSRNRSA